MMPFDVALDQLLSQVANGNATYLIRRGALEIVPRNHATATYLLRRPVLASFENRRFDDAIAELTERSGLTINIDPSVSEEASVPVNALFRNCTLEDALLTTTEMAKLKFVVFPGSVFVTTPSNAKPIEKDRKDRAAKRPRAKERE